MKENNKKTIDNNLMQKYLQIIDNLPPDADLAREAQQDPELAALMQAIFGMPDDVAGELQKLTQHDLQIIESVISAELGQSPEDNFDGYGAAYLQAEDRDLNVRARELFIFKE